MSAISHSFFAISVPKFLHTAEEFHTVTSDTEPRSPPLMFKILYEASTMN